MRQQGTVEPIALVGLSLRLPGDANDVDGLWELLQSGKSAWTPVPADRYNEDVRQEIDIEHSVLICERLSITPTRMTPMAQITTLEGTSSLVT